MNKIAPYYKAIAAFLVPLLTQIGVALTEASEGGSNITTSEWLAAVTISLVAGGVVFGVPNKDPLGQHQRESTQPPGA